MPDPVNKTTLQCRRCAGSGVESEVGVLPGIPPIKCHLCNGSGKQPVWAISPEGWEVQFRQRETAAGMSIEMQDLAVGVLLPHVRRRCNGR
jgi:hypothetical protein